MCLIDGETERTSRTMPSQSKNKSLSVEARTLAGFASAFMTSKSCHRADLRSFEERTASWMPSKASTTHAMDLASDMAAHRGLLCDPQPAQAQMARAKMATGCFKSLEFLNISKIR